MLQLERSGTELRTLRIAAGERTEKREHFTDRKVAEDQFRQRARSYADDGWLEGETRIETSRRRGATSGAFLVSAVWAGISFALGLPHLAQSPEAAVLVFFGAPGAVVPAALGAIAGAGPSRWSSAVLAAAIVGVLVWAAHVQPTLEGPQVAALAVFAVCVSALVTYCVLHLRRSATGRALLSP